jgi:hypothetical protein
MAADRAWFDRRSRTLAGLLELTAEAHTIQSKAPPWIGDAGLLASNNLGGMSGAMGGPMCASIGETTDLLFLPLD